MDLKTAFLASLNDEQLGLFYAHEYNANLSSLLQENVNKQQFELFEKWMEHKKAIAAENIPQTAAIVILSEKMDKIMELFWTRMDSIESKMNKNSKILDNNVSTKLGSLEQNMKLLQQQIVEMDASFEKIMTESLLAIREECSIKNDWNLLNEKVDNIWNDTMLTQPMDEKTALEWLKELENGIFSGKPEHFTKLNVEKTFRILKKFKLSKTIEERSCAVLFHIDDSTELVFSHITTCPGEIELLMNIALKHSDKKPIQYRHVLHFVRKVAECEGNRQILLKPEYLGLFLSNLLETNFSNSYLQFSLILVQLLDVSEDNFPKSVPREKIENETRARWKTEHSMQDVYLPSNNFKWYLDKIGTGSIAQRYFCSFLVASTPELDLDKYRIAGAIPFLHKISSDSKTDSYVWKNVYAALQKLKKKP